MGTLIYIGTWATGWVFLGLKLAGAIAWPWLVVLIPFAFVAGWTALFLVVLLLGGVAAAIGANRIAKWNQEDLLNISKRRGHPF